MARTCCPGRPAPPGDEADRCGCAGDERDTALLQQLSTLKGCCQSAEQLLNHPNFHERYEHFDLPLDAAPLAAQFEINARLLKGQRHIRELDVRVDYAYTILRNYVAYIDFFGDPRGKIT